MANKGNVHIARAIAAKKARGEEIIPKDGWSDERSRQQQAAALERVDRVKAKLNDQNKTVPADISQAQLTHENIMSIKDSSYELVNGYHHDMDERLIRIIFYYSLDPRASFSTGHEHTRACVATISYNLRTTGQARMLDVAYLNVVIEQQHTPLEFAARERFFHVLACKTEPFLQLTSQEKKRIDKARKYMHARLAQAALDQMEELEEVEVAFDGLTLDATKEFDSMGSVTEKMKLLNIMEGKTEGLIDMMQALQLKESDYPSVTEEE